MWVKICGITDPVIASRVAALGPDAIGLNFYSRSPRFVAVEVAREIVSQLPEHVEPVGLFVNSSQEEVQSVCRLAGIGTVQLHGDESPEFAASLPGLRLIRAFRVGDEGLGPVAAQLEEFQRRGVELNACLIDAKVQGSYGGTGHKAPWELLKDWRHGVWPPLILAGGLTPENVQDAIHTVHPFGVDTASGVEESPGRQSIERVKRFLDQSRQDF